MNSTLRRYQPLKPSAGVRIPSKLRAEVLARDGGCVGPRIGMPGPCFGRLELDHVRPASFGGKSETSAINLITLCANMHREKTLNGRKWRPRLLEWIATYGAAEEAALGGVAQRDEDGGGIAE